MPKALLPFERSSASSSWSSNSSGTVTSGAGRVDPLSFHSMSTPSARRRHLLRLRRLAKSVHVQKGGKQDDSTHTYPHSASLSADDVVVPWLRLEGCARRGAPLLTITTDELDHLPKSGGYWLEVVRSLFTAARRSSGNVMGRWLDRATYT